MAKEVCKLNRDIRNIYLAILKDGGQSLDLRDLVKFYMEYMDLRGRIVTNASAPNRLKMIMPKVKMPKYLQWIRRYLIQKEDE